MEDGILVSISCTTYNHENYIGEALASFLMQKTNFLYEILIHDDASTDMTAAVIREFEQKFPERVKPVYQTENQYSRGVDVGLNNTKRARGQYIAVCEGDDFWTDPEKLQKQADYMEKHPKCSLCVHGAGILDAATGKWVGSIRPSRYSRTFGVEEILTGGGGLFATSSMMYLKDQGIKRPDFYYKTAPVGDYPLMIHLSLQGTVYYMDECMSVYRFGAPGSWTRREFSTLTRKIRHYRNTEKMLDELNAYTNYRYDRAISRKKRRNRAYLLLTRLCPGILHLLRQSKRKYPWALR